MIKNLNLFWYSLQLSSLLSLFDCRVFKDCVRYIFASLFFKFKRKHFWNLENQILVF